MPAQLDPVNDDTGARIGTVELVLLGRAKRRFWNARAFDGADLGAHVDRVEAEWAVRDDWDAGCPRSPRSPRQKFRPIYDMGVTPVFARPRPAPITVGPEGLEPPTSSV